MDFGMDFGWIIEDFGWIHVKTIENLHGSLWINRIG